MDKKQKKIILIVLCILTILISIAGIVCWIYGIINKDKVAHIFGMVTSVISPSLIVGVAIKQIIHILNKRDLEKFYKSNGVIIPKIEKLSKKHYKIEDKPYLQYKGYTFYMTEDHLVVDFANIENLTTEEKIELFKQAFNEFMEQVRKDTITVKQVN